MSASLSMQASPVRRRLVLASLALPGLALCGVFACASWLTTTQLAALVSEDGPVENATAALYGLLMLAIAMRTRVHRADPRTTAALLVVVAALAAREFDLHRTSAGASVLKFSFYGSDAAWTTKALALLAVGSVVLALIVLARRHGRALLRGWRTFEPAAFPLLVFIAALVVAKSLDRGVTILNEDLGIAFEPAAVVVAQACEEMLELCLPLLGLLAVLRSRAAVPGPGRS